MFQKKRERSIRLSYLIIPVLIVIGGFLFYKVNFFGSKSEIVLLNPETNKVLDTSNLSFGRNTPWILRVENKKDNICEVNGTIEVNGTQIPAYSYRGHQSSIDILATSSDMLAQGTQEGPGTLNIVVKNCALIKNTTNLKIPVTIDFTPPTVAITSSQHYVNQGGADVATYSVSGDVAWSGIKVGPYEFKGYKLPNQDDESGMNYFAFFVFSYELTPDTPIEIIARDTAGNEGKATLTIAKFFPKEFRHRELPIDDKFIDTKVSDIIANTPTLRKTGDRLKDYLSVNRDLRKKNAEFLKQLSTQSEEKFYWIDAFLPLNNASVEASFADYRSYIYNGEKVDEQVHLGFDLAAVEKNPIYASARGKIIFSGYLGIYGNTVIIDHGYGLMSLYAHLSSMDVKEGDIVERQQKIANSGATGLAGGDHLHYSMLIQGVQTNPVEFWDQHWIQDHVYLRINKTLFSESKKEPSTNSAATEH